MPLEFLFATMPWESFFAGMPWELLMFYARVIDHCL